jgi:hypothetical protein
MLTGMDQNLSVSLAKHTTHHGSFNELRASTNHSNNFHLGLLMDTRTDLTEDPAVLLYLSRSE